MNYSKIQNSLMQISTYPPHILNNFFRLAHVLKTLLIGAFYCYLIPLVSIICAITLIIIYIMYKYLLVYGYSFPDPIGEG